MATTSASNPGTTRSLAVALRPGLGWTIERTLLYVASRLDLGALLTGTPTLAPGVPDDAVTVPELADAVPAAFGNDPARWEFSSPQFRWQDIPPYEGRNGLDIAQTTALGLRWFGYRDAQADRTSRTPAILASAAFVDIRTCTTATDLGTVQRLTGVASVEGKHAVVISSAGFTRDALRWAAKAGMALFQLSPASGDLRPVSALASAFMTPLPERDWHPDEAS
jgi:hypothetical protein